MHSTCWAKNNTIHPTLGFQLVVIEQQNGILLQLFRGCYSRIHIKWLSMISIQLLAMVATLLVAMLVGRSVNHNKFQ